MEGTPGEFLSLLRAQPTPAVAVEIDSQNDELLRSKLLFERPLDGMKCRTGRSTRLPEIEQDHLAAIVAEADRFPVEVEGANLWR
jgi:hypothetical protein